MALVQLIDCYQLTMKPKSKGRLLGQHEAASCYDFTMLRQALSLAHNSLIDNVSVDHHGNDSMSLENKSTASCVYDFSKVAEALAIMDKEALDALPFGQRRKDYSKSINKNRDDEKAAADDLALGQRLVIGRRSSRTKKNRNDELLNVKKAVHKKVLKDIKTKRWQNMFILTLKSLKKCS